MDDIFSQFGDVFGEDIFGSFFGGGRRGGGGTRSRGTRGSNLRVKIKLTFEEIAKGVSKNIKVKKYVGCSTCSGTGERIKEVYKPAVPAAAVDRSERCKYLSGPDANGNYLPNL